VVGGGWCDVERGELRRKIATINDRPFLCATSAGTF
jgi:hypothetical protein